MADFKKALQDGLEANANAEAARTEIVGVISDLSSQIRKATGGQITIELRRSVRDVVRQLTSLARVLGADSTVEKVTYTALVAARNNPEDASELAELRMAAAGYPVTLTAPGVSDMARDRAGLETALATRLRHPDTGRRCRSC